MEIEKETLIYDIETATFDGAPNPEKDRLKFFGCYSYITNKYYILTDKAQIQKIINAHKYLVGFNNEGRHKDDGYDNRVLLREGIDLKYKVFVDLMVVFMQRAAQMKIKKGMLGDLLMEYSLDYITRMLDLVDDSTAKGDIDYSVFNKNSWTTEELKNIHKYTKRDVEITKKLYEWVEDYFWTFREFLDEKDVKNKTYIRAGFPKFAYKVICKELGWPEKYGQAGLDKGANDSISGGYVAYPAGEKFEGEIYCMDYNCLPKSTMISLDFKTYNKYFKKIEDLKIGDVIKTYKNKKGIVDNIKIQDYNGDLIEIRTQHNQKICCTPSHIIPVYRDDKFIEVEAQNILETDDLITTKTRRGKNNPNFKNAQIEKKCIVCGNTFIDYKNSVVKCCNSECSNIMRSENSAKTNLGRTKYDTPHLMKLSKKRKDKKRSLEICKNISIGTNKDVQQDRYNNGKYEHNGIFFKSEYELKVAKAFDRDNIKWEYQPKVFTINNEFVYTPDFYLPEINTWVEVKGPIIIDTKSNTNYKFRKFCKEYPNSVIIQPKDIKKLKEALQW